MDPKKSKIPPGYLFEPMRDALYQPTRSRMYKLEGKTLIPCDWDEYHEWQQSLKEGVVHVGEDFIDDVRVSTVFLGIDHNYEDKGPPVLFETMVFGGSLNEYQTRYCTWEEAAAGHKAVCEAVRISSAKGVN